MSPPPAPSPLSASATSSISTLIDQTTSTPNKIPGVVLAAVSRSGAHIFAHASGIRGLDWPEQRMSLENVFWIASCTKLVTAIAALQLVEKGVLKLDDSQEVERFVPELGKVKVLEGFDEKGEPVLREKKVGITLRMLLSHTAGFGYSFFNEKLRRYGSPGGIDEFSAYPESLFNSPLLHEPGTKWEYGINLDFAGLVISRATSMTLDAYFKKHIFEPLDITEASFFPSASMLEKLAHMHMKTPTGQLLPYDHPLRRPLVAREEERSELACYGGGGLFATVPDYLKILTELLNEGGKLLSPASTELLFKNQLDLSSPAFANFSRTLIPASKPHLTNPIPEMYPQPHDQPQGWSFAGLNVIHPAPTGRGKESVQWAGLANLFWWVDREKGVAGMIASQILPFGDPDVGMLWFQAESAIYAALNEQEAKK